MRKFINYRIRALGQHFLKSRGVLEKIVSLVDPQKDDLILEIGAGKGALTIPLAERGGSIIAVEKDPNLASYLRQISLPNLHVVEGDVLTLGFRDLLKKENAGVSHIKVAGNLPYSISSPLLFKIIQEREALERCVLLIQKEVAERICAGPGTKKYAPISILVSIYFLAGIHFIVAPGAFAPPPRVDSAVLSLTRRPKPLFPVYDDRPFLAFLRKCFGQRRKTLFNNLTAAGYPAARLGEAFVAIGLERKVRPEHVDIGSFVALCNFLAFKPSP
jgi:16S rRNA (adenine1518-N6/adenine1519-N6)-dimethyltransferase